MEPIETSPIIVNLDFASLYPRTQVATSGRITDFSCANFIWNKIKSKRWTWEELDAEFRELRNEILTDFRKVSEK